MAVSCSAGVAARVAVNTEQEINGFGGRSIIEANIGDEVLIRGGYWDSADSPVLSEG
jgi:hypothetical protein